jgi:hypothetical protein
MVVWRAYYLEQQELSLAASCPAPCVSRVPPAGSEVMKHSRNFENVSETIYAKNLHASMLHNKT